MKAIAKEAGIWSPTSHNQSNAAPWNVQGMWPDFPSFRSCVEKRLWVDKSGKRRVHWLVASWWLLWKDIKARERWTGHRCILEIWPRLTDRSGAGKVKGCVWVLGFGLGELKGWLAVHFRRCGWVAEKWTREVKSFVRTSSFGLRPLRRLNCWMG